MYCPKCGKENAEAVKYCRSCGENLSAISRAMTRRLPVVLGMKLDAYLERKNELVRRDSIVSGITGVIFLLMGLWGLIQGTSVFSTVGVPLSLAAFMFLASAWNYLAFRRSLSEAPKTSSEPIGSISDKDMVRDTPLIAGMPPAVTESTTIRIQNRR